MNLTHLSDKERQRIFVKHNNFSSLQTLEILLQELNYTPLTARSYYAFMETYRLNDRKVAAILYQLEPRGEEFPQQHRRIYPLEIITSIKRKNPPTPFIALYPSGSQIISKQTLLSYGANAILEYPFTKELLQETINSLKKETSNS